MSMFRPMAAVAVVALLGVAACDSRDYESELAALEEELQEAHNQLQEAQSENEQMTTEMEEMRAQSEQSAPGDEAMEEVKSQLSSVIQTATQTADRLSQLEEEPNAPAEQLTEAYTVLRENVQGIADSARSAAEQLGIEVQTGG